MAIEYSGINYFPLLTGFFHSDKIELLTAMYGIKGPFAAVMLLCKIYADGYYISWGKEQCMIFTRKLGPEYNNDMVEGIVKTLLEKDFFMGDKTTCVRLVELVKCMERPVGRQLSVFKDMCYGKTKCDIRLH